MSAKSQRSGGEAPPLATWLWVVAFLCLFAGAALAFVPGPNAHVLAAYASRIDDFVEEHRGSPDPRVVLLGTSLAYRALPTGPEAEQRLGVAFLKLARPGIRFHFYEPLIDRIFAARPDLILLQTELFREAGAYRVRELREALRLALRGQWGGRGRGIDPPDFGDCAGRQAPALLPQAVANVRAEFPGFDGLPRSARRFLDRAAEEGVPVVLLDLPRTPTLEAATGGRARRWRDEVEATLAPWPTLRSLRYDGAAGDGDFCDFAHLHPAGRDRFLAWLRPRLHRLLAGERSGERG